MSVVDYDSVMDGPEGDAAEDGEGQKDLGEDFFADDIVPETTPTQKPKGGFQVGQKILATGKFQHR